MEFESEFRASHWMSSHEQVLDELLGYLREESAPLPTSPISHFYPFRTLFSSLETPDSWDAFDHRLLAFFTAPSYWQPPSATHHYYNGFRWVFFGWLADQVREETVPNTTAIAAVGLHRHGVPETDFLSSVLVQMSHLFLNERKAAGSAGRYVLSQIPAHLPVLLPLLAGNRDFHLVELLLHHNEPFLRRHLAELLPLLDDGEGYKFVSFPAVALLLETDAAYYEPRILEKLSGVSAPACRLEIHRLLGRFVPEQYQDRQLEYAYEFLERMRQQMTKLGENFREPVRWNEDWRLRTNLLDEQIDFVLTREGLKARDYLHGLLKDCRQISVRVLETIVKHLGQQALDLLMEGLRMDINKMYDGSTYYRRFFALLTSLDYEQYYPQIWALTKHKSKKMREITAVALSKLGPAAIPGAVALLEAKAGDQRQTGALILSLIPGEASRTILLDALEQEKNDDARDLMLESLVATLPPARTREAIGEKVRAAQRRGKLDKPLEPWLDESRLPKLYWEASGEELDPLTVRFLLYRQSRPKDVRPDSEARPLLDGLDRGRSAPFANAILKTYLENGADSKQKYVLTLAGRLGDDQTIAALKAKVTQWADAARGKMAENAVKALALAGTNKALRAVEFFSRKYKSKNKNIGEAAGQAFVLAAEELGITPYELADSIIPDFGFEGLFRPFEAGGEPYRAFVDNAFKLAFLDEDGKVLKSPPKGTDKTLAEEFKEISKEIRDIVKSQSGRLEQYLVTQRKWPVEKWQSFFLGNPVMFAYAVRLVWGVYDGGNRLQFTFRCLEDQTLVNRENDEAELPEGSLIGMVHPLDLSAEEVAYWNEHLADSDVEPIFPQLDRPVIPLPPGDEAKKMSYAFRDVKVGGYHFVSRMERMGWYRGSVVDAGMISSYYKDFTDLHISAFLNLEGIGVGYYDADAVLGEVYFVRPRSIRTGSYTYDEPGSTDDDRLIPFGQVPAVVYSEIMSDLGQFVQQEEVPAP